MDASFYVVPAYATCASIATACTARTKHWSERCHSRSRYPQARTNCRRSWRLPSSLAVRAASAAVAVSHRLMTPAATAAAHPPFLGMGAQRPNENRTHCAPRITELRSTVGSINSLCSDGNGAAQWSSMRCQGWTPARVSIL